MMMLPLMAAVLIGYLLGSISVAVLLTKLHYGGDIRQQGSGNAGATNVTRIFGFGAGLITLLGDALKALVAMYLGRLLAGDGGAVLAAAACMLGHCLPLFFGFRGGKGVTVGAAIALWLDWRLLLLLIAVFILVFLLSRRVSLCSLAAALSYPFGILLLLRDAPGYTLTLGIWITLLVFLMHRDNIRRLLLGTEPRFQPRRKGRN